jgi:hypothetical protein
MENQASPAQSKSAAPMMISLIRPLVSTDDESFMSDRTDFIHPGNDGATVPDEKCFYLP